MTPNTAINDSALRDASFHFMRNLERSQHRADECSVAAALDDLAERFGEELCEALSRAGHKAKFVG